MKKESNLDSDIKIASRVYKYGEGKNPDVDEPDEIIELEGE